MIKTYDGVRWSAEHPSDDASSDDAALPAVRQRTLVVVEDDLDLRIALEKVLKLAGYHVRGFASAEAVLEALDRGLDVDCILSDVRLPQLSGVDLARKLSHLGHSVPLVLMTGYSDVAAAVEGMKAGASDFIEKPMSADRLVQVVGAAVASRQEHLFGDEARSRRHAFQTLNERQRQIFDCICQGLTSKEIARNLEMSHRTVENHRTIIMDKLQACSLADLIRIKLTIKIRSGQ